MIRKGENIVKKITKLGVSIILFLIVISCCKTTHAESKIIHIDFNSENIFTLVLQQLDGKYYNYDNEEYSIDITKDEIEKVTELYFDGQYAEQEKATDLQGLEKFTKLNKLEIYSNRLDDLSILKKLNNLKELTLNSCELSDLGELQSLVNLKKLDLGNNQIEDISPLENLTNLEKLKLDNNQIKNISSLQRMTKLTGLDLSSNKISNISALKNMKQLTLPGKKYENGLIPIYLLKLINFEHLFLDDNQIVNVSAIDKKILKDTSVQQQTLYVKTNKKEIELPNLFKENNVEQKNCKIYKYKAKIKIQDTNQPAEIRVTEGIFNGSVITIECDDKAPELMVNYGEPEGENQKVKVSITSNEEIRPVKGWTLAENRRKLIKVYFKNMKEELVIQDIAGNQSKITVLVKNANRPILNIEYTTIKDYSALKGQEIIEEADKYLGNPYVLQGDSLTDGIDCSHFVYRILQICGLYDGKYIRSTNWINVGEEVKDLEHAIAGDIIVWDGHVAFYDGNGKIVEAKGKKWGITHDRVASKAIEKETYMGIRRVTGNQRIEKKLGQNESTDGYVKVTIYSNKVIRPVKGWKLSDNKKVLTKIFEENNNEVIKINDYEKNEVEADIRVTNIFK